VIDAAAAKATEIGQPMDIAVVDAGGNLKAHLRMDGANIGSITISINKAYTSIAFQCETGDLQGVTRQDGPIYGLSDAHGGRLAVFPRRHPASAQRQHHGRHWRLHRHHRVGPGGRRGGRRRVLTPFPRRAGSDDGD
jgi:hypothetical protein